MAKQLFETIELIAAVITYGKFCWILSNKIFEFVKAIFTNKQK